MPRTARLSPPGRAPTLAAFLGFFALVGLAIGPAPVEAEAIFEDKGLYRNDRWEIGKRYDDLSDPTDRPGVLTSGKDPRNPSGPAVDLENRPGTPERGRAVPDRRMP